MDAVTCAALSCLQYDKNIVTEVVIVLQMWTEGRYNELLFISDTCQAASLYGSIRSPNIVAMASSKIGKALSLQCKAFSLCCNSHATMPILLAVKSYLSCPRPWLRPSFHCLRDHTLPSHNVCPTQTRPSSAHMYSLHACATRICNSIC